MPNQKQRLKKDGVNKSKKMAAMREKEAMARPPSPPSATGKGPQTSKPREIHDRPPRTLNRA